MNELGASRALYRGGLFLVVVFIAALILHELLYVIIQLFVASIIAAAMTPIVNSVMASDRVRRSRLGPHRGIIVVIVFLLAALITAVFGFLVLRAIVREVADLAANVPQYQEAFRSWLAATIRAYPGVLDVSLDTWVAANVQVALNALPAAVGTLADILSVAGGLLGGMLTVLLTVFLALYITMDAGHMRDYMVVFWPYDRQGQVGRMSNEMGTRLGHWAIGQGLLCLIIGGGAWIGLQLIGVPYAAALGLVWALAEFIPGIGPFVSAVPSILLGFTVSPTVGVASALFCLVWSQVENNIITPKVMGSAVELHPLVVLTALIVGAELLGMAGALLAIPLAATLAVVVDEIRQERIRSQISPIADGLTPASETAEAAALTAETATPVTRTS